MWFIGQFENGSWGFQQKGCIPRYTSKHEAETIRDTYEALEELTDFDAKGGNGKDHYILIAKAKDALSKYKS